MVVVAGIDVSKAALEVSISEGPVLSLKNSAAGIRRLLRHLERAGMTKAVCESTGGYERPVVGKLREAELSVPSGTSTQGALIRTRLRIRGEDCSPRCSGTVSPQRGVL